MADSIIAEYGKYRVITRPPVSQFSDTVFVQRWMGADWKDVRSFNTLSDDYAYTNAREDAEWRQKMDERPEPPAK